MMNGKHVLESSPAKDLLHRKEKGSGSHSLRPLDHLAFAIMLDGGAGVEESLDALQRLRQEFVDWNEVRVARTQELVRTLGDLASAERVALRIKEDYNAFFDKKGALNFDFLAAGKPAETRRALVQLLPHLNKGAVSLLLFEFCPGASLPLSDEGMKQAKKDALIGKNADRNQLVRVLLEALDPAEICLLAQYWELESTGHPYGEAGRRGSQTAKKVKKTAPRAKAKTGKTK